MKKKQKREIWDKYYDKQLALLVTEMEFDFDRIAKTMNNVTKTKDYTNLNCRQRWAHIHSLRKSSKKASLEPQQQKKTLEEMFEELPEERKPHDYLKVTKEDLEKAESICAITGEIIKPSGYNVLKDKFYSKEFLEEKRKKDAEFLKQFDNLKEKVEMIDLGMKVGEQEEAKEVEKEENFKLFYVERKDGKLQGSSVDFFSQEAERIKKQMSGLVKKQDEVDQDMIKVRQLVDRIDEHRFKPEEVKRKREDHIRKQIEVAKRRGGGFSRAALYTNDDDEDDEDDDLEGLD